MPSVARFLEGCRAQGHHVTYLACFEGAAQSEKEEKGIRVRMLGSPFPRDPSAIGSKLLRILAYKLLSALACLRLYRAGSRELRSRSYDVIYCMTSVPAVASYLLHRKHKLPLVIRLFGTFLEPEKLGLFMRLARLEETVAFKLKSDLLVITDDGTRGDLVARKLGVNPEKVLFLRNGIDAEFFVPIERAEARKQIGLSGDYPIVLWVSRLVGWKRWDRFIAMMPYVIKEVPDVRFVLLGDGPDRVKIESQIASLGLENHVVLPGFVTQSLVAAYMSGSDALVSTNDHGNAGNQVLQAMAIGLPVIISGAGSTPDREGVATLMVDPQEGSKALANVVLQVLRNKQLAASLSEAGKKIARGIGDWGKRVGDELNAVKKACNRN